MKKILITGHTGFIGQHMVEVLKQKYEIIGVSRKNTGIKIKNLKKDVRKITMKDIPEEIDCIIHLASLTDVQYCQQNPLECFDVNITGTQNVLEIARQKKSKFIFMSSSHVYGIPKKLPISENNQTNPMSTYSHSKVIGEMLCNAYSKNYDLDISIARIFSVYGAHSPQHQVITKILNHLIFQKKLQLGNLFPKRDFIHIQDVISAIITLVKQTNGFNIYNIGTGKSSSINEVISILTKITKKNIQIETDITKINNNEIKEIRSDSSKIMSLDWKPKFDLSKGLRQTIQEITNKD
jgi:nucleoside-diphosphate-sugar epimerase